MTSDAAGGKQPIPETLRSEESAQGFRLLYNETPSDHFEDPKVGAVRYLGVYQATDPNAVSGTIDVPRVVGEVRRIVAENPDARWGMLDFEHPYNEILLAGPSDPRHAAAVRSMVELVRAVRREHPEIRWTYYGMPRLPYWTSGQAWSRIDSSTRRRLFDEAQASYGAILRELDWIQPSVYDKYERALGFPLNDRISGDAAERAFRTAHVEVIQDWFARTGTPPVPVIPVVTPWFLGKGKSTMYRAIPEGEFLADQIHPLLEAGADGISIWSSMRHKINIATIDFIPNSAYSREIQPVVRSVFASDVLELPGTWQATWTASEVKHALESHCNAVLENAMRLIEKARQSRPVIASGADSEKH
jgi:hypothetical protein